MKPNDKKVKEFREIVAMKKAEIAKAEKLNWLTNCTFSYNRDTSNPHQRFNIQTVTDPKEFVEALAFLIVQERSFAEAANELGVSAKFKWQGFDTEDWKQDFQTRISRIKIAEKKKELAQLEVRLNALLSEDLKAELELIEIEKLLKQ